MPKSHFIESAELCIANGEQLLNDADSLSYQERAVGTSLALAIIAQEEFAKAFLLVLAARQVIPWNSLVHRATRDHKSKQLVGLVLDHLSPDTDEFLAQSYKFLAERDEHKRLCQEYRDSTDEDERQRIWVRIQEISTGWESHPFPSHVADAIFIFCHEKLGRWKSSNWFWVEEPEYDPQAKLVAEGTIDQEKQDALYVRLGREGHAVGSPTSVRYEDAKAAMETAGRMKSFVKSLIEEKVSDPDYEKTEGAFKVAFASLTNGETKSS
jgi:AbiV family abortive infection protein